MLLNKCCCVSLLTEIIEKRPCFTQEAIDPLTKEMTDLVVLLTSGGMDKKVYRFSTHNVRVTGRDCCLRVVSWLKANFALFSTLKQEECHLKISRLINAY